ncbi:dicarboxylate/amino acid:cation symporter [Caulobacter endophyticus]|nr:cation:dicarboxylase symporter family transporter [Caulobacter endophyticus]
MNHASAPPRPPLGWNTPSTRILIGLAIGLAAGMAVGGQAPHLSEPALAMTTPIGRLWLDALTMTVVPLVFGLLVTAIGSAASSASAGGATARAMAWFSALLIGACAIGALVTLPLLDWLPIPDGGLTLRSTQAPSPPVEQGAWFEGLIPANPVKAAAETSMTPLVVFALFFGFAMTRIREDLRISLARVFEGLVETMLVIVRWVLLAGPLGVMALGFGVGAQAGGGAAGALLHYVLTVVFACLAVTVAAYILVALVGRISPFAFARRAGPVQAIALGTQSSLACLPAMIDASSAMRTSVSVSSVVLPLAVAIFRAASGAANVAVAIYLAKAHGVALTPATVCVAVLVAAAVSLAAVGLPAQVSFFATIGPVALALGAPLGALPLLLAVETIPDLFRTLGNVTADLAVTRILGRPRSSQPVEASHAL